MLFRLTFDDGVVVVVIAGDGVGVVGIFLLFAVFWFVDIVFCTCFFLRIFINFRVVRGCKECCSLSILTVFCSLFSGGFEMCNIRACLAYHILVGVLRARVFGGRA